MDNWDYCSEFETSAETYEKLNYGQIFFIMLGVIPVALCLPIWFVAVFVHGPYVKKIEKQMEDLEDLEDYEIPYIETYDLEKVTNDNAETLDCEINSVLETTPDGVVVMRYNKTDEGFDYWADKQISYKHLEVVARKFVTVFQCKEFYIDQKKYMKNKLDKIKKEIEENKKTIQQKKENAELGKTDPVENDDMDVFAKLKSNKRKLKVKFTKDDFTPEIGTKFMKKGKMAESILEKKTEVDEKVVKNVNFSDWKSLFGFGSSVSKTEEQVSEPLTGEAKKSGDESSEDLEEDLEEDSGEDSGEDINNPVTTW
jgi:hypothetical protein